MIFGKSGSKFEYSGSTVMLEHSNIIPKYIDSDNIENKSVLTGKKNFINLGDYSSFDVPVYLYKYTSSKDVFLDLYSYLHKNVYFWPHSDGKAISGSSGNPVTFNITNMDLTYLNNIDFPEYLIMHFESNEYTNISGNII